MENGIRPPIQMAVESMRDIAVGYQGEKNAQLIRINVKAWQEKWLDASIDLVLSLPGEKTSYPVHATVEGNELIYLFTAADTQKAGHGLAYVAATRGDEYLASSATVITEILPKGRGGDMLPEAPEPQAGWVDEVLSAADRAENAAIRQPIIGENGNWHLWDAETGAYVDSGVKAQGEPGKDAEPYTLPTASAEVKGGVKVGNGLRMDGETLGVVPEGAYELIETITVSEEGIAEFIRTFDEPLKGILVGVLCPIASGISDGFLEVNTQNPSVSFVAGGRIMDATYNRSSRMCVQKNNGIWDASFEGNVPGWGGGNKTGQNKASEIYLTTAESCITSARIYAVAQKFPVWTSIEIYGVKANA